MAKKKTVAAEPQQSAPVVPFDPAISTQDREVVKADEKISRYTLDDGSILNIRPILAEVKRAKNKFSALGDPIYFMKIGFVVTTKIPARLKQKRPKTKKA